MAPLMLLAPCCFQGTYTLAWYMLCREMHTLLGMESPAAISPEHAGGFAGAYWRRLFRVRVEETLGKGIASCHKPRACWGLRRGLLEEILDDDEELAQLNLSSRPAREDRQRERERDRLKRGSEWCVSTAKCHKPLPAWAQKRCCYVQRATSRCMCGSSIVVVMCQREFWF